MTLLAKPEELIGQLSAQGTARSTVAGAPLYADELNSIDAYWRACNYLALGMIYLQANPLSFEIFALSSTSRTTRNSSFTRQSELLQWIALSIVPKRVSSFCRVLTRMAENGWRVFPNSSFPRFLSRFGRSPAARTDKSDSIRMQLRAFRRVSSE